MMLRRVGHHIIDAPRNASSDMSLPEGMEFSPKISVFGNIFLGKHVHIPLLWQILIQSLRNVQHIGLHGFQRMGQVL